MSSKIGLLISLVFFALFFVLSVDVMCIQFHYSDLDSKSVVIAYEISRMDNLDESHIKELEEKHHVLISYVSSSHPSFGDTVSFILLKEYKPLIVSNDVMDIKIERSTVIGYF